MASSREAARSTRSKWMMRLPKLRAFPDDIFTSLTIIFSRMRGSRVISSAVCKGWVVFFREPQRSTQSYAMILSKKRQTPVCEVCLLASKRFPIRASSARASARISGAATPKLSADSIASAS